MTTPPAGQPDGPAPPAGPPPASPPSGWNASTGGNAAVPTRRRIAGPFVFGLFLVFVGAFFLIQQVAPDVQADRLWPILSVVFGAILIAAALFTGD